MKNKFLVYLVILSLFVLPIYAVPGTAPEQSEVAIQSVMIADSTSLQPVVTETGKISLSIDGLGSNSASGIIQVEKPTGATVRSAYMAAADVWGSYGGPIPNGAVQINGNNVNWDSHVHLYTNNAWADVTSIVKPIVDAAPSGRVDLTITESSTYSMDGEVLAVIFDDPAATINTIILFFGAQNIAGDTFAIGLADPLDTGNPDLVLDMSLGISFGYQTGGGGQYSIVNVNGERMTTSAGGQDDGDPITIGNGGLLTVGGLDDSNANPADPYATPSNPKTDDELYNLLPFVENGDTSINVYTQNPSTDDNIFFAALFLGSATAIVGEGIVLGPSYDSNPINTDHTVMATVQDDAGAPVVGKTVTFEIISGPNMGMTHSEPTDSNGHAYFTWSSSDTGIDVVEARFMNSQDQETTSNLAEKEWYDRDEEPEPQIPEFTAIGAGIVLLGAIGLAIYRRNK